MSLVDDLGKPLDVSGWPLRKNHIMVGKRGHYNQGQLVKILMDNVTQYLHWDNADANHPTRSTRESMIGIMSTQDELVSLGLEKDNRSFINKNINLRTSLAQMIAMSVTTNSVAQPLTLPLAFFHLDETTVSINEVMRAIVRGKVDLDNDRNEVAALKNYMETCTTSTSRQDKCCWKKIAYFGFKCDYYSNLRVIYNNISQIPGATDKTVTLWATPSAVFQKYKGFLERLTEGGVFDSYVNHVSWNKSRNAGKVKKEAEQKKKQGKGYNSFSGVL